MNKYLRIFILGDHYIISPVGNRNHSSTMETSIKLKHNFTMYCRGHQLIYLTGHNRNFGIVHGPSKLLTSLNSMDKMYNVAILEPY